MAQFKPQKSKLSAPKAGGGNGMAQLMAYMVAQQKGQAGESQMPGGQAVRRTDPSTGTTFESGESRKYTADAQNQLNRIMQLKQVVKGVQDLGRTLPTDFMSAAKGTFGAEKLYGRMGSGEHKTYMDSLPAASVGVYRAVTGDNRLSDADAAARAKPLFWHPMEPSDVREGKNAFIDFMMGEAEQNITPGEPTDDVDSMIRWQSFVDNAKKKFSPSGSGSGSSGASGAMVRVRHKISGKTGTVPLSNFNPDKYEKV